MNKWLPYPECDTCPANYGQCIVDGACHNHSKEENPYLTGDYKKQIDMEEDNGTDCSKAEQK